MFTDPQAYLFVLALAVAVFWSIPASKSVWRAVWLILISGIFVFVLSPLALGAILAVTLTGILTLHVALTLKSKTVAWLGVAIIAAEFLVFQFLNGQTQDGPIKFAVVLGLSYVCFKTIACILNMKTYERRPGERPSIIDFLLLNTFFPIIPSGPIEDLKQLRTNRLASEFNGQRFVYGLVRIAVGFFTFHFLGETLIQPYLSQTSDLVYGVGFSSGLLEAWTFCILSLLFLYVNFSGFMSVAVGSGALFGLSISENFRSPFVATNIQDFWKRWHVTLGEFANKHLYFPLLKVFRGNPYVSIICTFLIIGLWHEVSLSFLLWGIAHGLALAVFAWYSRLKFSDSNSNGVRYIRQGAGWLITMLFVCWAWTFAIAPDLSSGIRFTLRLIGLEDPA